MASVFTFPLPNDEVIRFLQTIKGIFFDKERKCWSLPNDPDTIATIRHKLGDSFLFKNKPQLVHALKNQHLITESGTLRIVKALDSQLNLYLAYQKEHVAFLKTLPYCQWNKRDKHWNLPDTEATRSKIKGYFDPLGFRIEFSRHKPVEKKKSTFVPKFKKTPPNYLEKLSIKRYSPNTARTYIAAFDSL